MAERFSVEFHGERGFCANCETELCRHTSEMILSMGSECCQITADGWCATHSTKSGPVYPPDCQRAARLQAILTDLITDLRERHPAGEYCCCGWCKRDEDAADRAEARLNDVSMSLNKGHDDE